MTDISNEIIQRMVKQFQPIIYTCAVYLDIHSLHSNSPRTDDSLSSLRIS